jgi:hypothetical protein
MNDANLPTRQSQSGRQRYLGGNLLFSRHLYHAPTDMETKYFLACPDGSTPSAIVATPLSLGSSLLVSDLKIPVHTLELISMLTWPIQFDMFAI